MTQATAMDQAAPNEQVTSPAPAAPSGPVAEQMPGVVMGVEQEYKWRVDPIALLGTTNPTLDDMAAALPPPRRSELELRFRHTQSTIYFDDGWRLTDGGIALRATVNPGQARDVAWLGVKQTIVWRDGCRDSLEVAERLDPRGISRELRDRRTVSMEYLVGLCGQQFAPVAFGYVVQQRSKLFFRTDGGWLLQVTFDEAVFHRVAGAGNAEPLVTHWLEIENNTADIRARHELNRWAEVITERLGRQPSEQAKAELAAARAGWTPGRPDAGSPARGLAG